MAKRGPTRGTSRLFGELLRDNPREFLARGLGIGHFHVQMRSEVQLTILQYGRHEALSVFRLGDLLRMKLKSIYEDLTLLSVPLPFGHSFRNPFVVSRFGVFSQPPLVELSGV